MNDRMKELAIKAQVEHCISHVRLKEFAELIIRDCAKIADIAEPYNSSNLIKNHFGIKE